MGINARLASCVSSAGPNDRHVSNGKRSMLYISPVWPEPESSAAGVRTQCLIKALQTANWDVSYLSISKPNKFADRLQQNGCKAFYCPPNKKRDLAEILAATQPDACIFDRFIAEEAFSFRVRSLVPAALRVLDLQDLHSLRRARQAKFQLEGRWEGLEDFSPSGSDDLLRELAAIHRSDLALVCSAAELQFLTGKYGVSAEKLQLAPFFIASASTSAKEQPGFSERQHLLTIGNFRHAPNVDSVMWLAEELWPAIAAQLPPGTQMHCYGAYASSAAIRQLHKPEVGFHIKGQAKTLDMMNRYRLCLAPLRFGAGLKGKIVDSWQHALPVITTQIGAEGLLGCGDSSSSWGGRYTATSPEEFIKHTVHLYTDQDAWSIASRAGQALVTDLFDARKTMPPVLKVLEDGLLHIKQLREANLTGNILWLQRNRATEYFSRWIELKEGKKRAEDCGT